MEQSAKLPAATADKISRAAKRCGVSVERFLAIAANVLSFSPCRNTATGRSLPSGKVSFSTCRNTANDAHA